MGESLQFSLTRFNLPLLVLAIGIGVACGALGGSLSSKKRDDPQMQQPFYPPPLQNS